MTIILAVDLGTTKITCIGVDTANGEIQAIGTANNEANVTKPENRTRGHSEWNVDAIFDASIQCLTNVAGSQLQARSFNGQRQVIVRVEFTDSVIRLFRITIP